MRIRKTSITADVYLPVVKATDVLDILNLILRIMCEAWLDHIYTQKIKFRYELIYTSSWNFIQTDLFIVFVLVERVHWICYAILKVFLNG